jgi:hypothetical protein
MVAIRRHTAEHAPFGVGRNLARLATLAAPAIPFAEPKFVSDPGRAPPSLHRCRVIALLLALLLAKEDPGRVMPDRPNMANSTEIVAPGAVQFEAGIDAQVHGYAREDRFRVSVPQSIRVGLVKDLELRIFDGDPVRALAGQLGARQQGEVDVGAKLRLWARETGARPSLGLQWLMIPANRRAGATFRGLLPGLVFIVDVEPGDWHIDLNAGLKMHKTDAGGCCDAEAMVAASVGRSFLDERVLVWGELYSRADVARGTLTELSGDAGVIVTATRRLAVDAGLLLGKADDAFVVAVLAGMSLRIGP